MPRASRQRREPTDDWQQLRLLTRFPEHLTYEIIRPIVLFGSSPAERARQTGEWLTVCRAATAVRLAVALLGPVRLLPITR